jgi:biotin-dependent carboxylase-like uncharacterized protein
MDAWSHRLANAAVGNAAEAAILEVTVTGPLLACADDTQLAITGAPFAIQVEGRTWRSPLVLQAAAGTTVDFGECLAGTRAYVAVAGGFQVPLVLGSRSTDLRGAFGGYAGRALRAGDSLAHAMRSGHPQVREWPEASMVGSRDAVTPLRVVPGPQDDEAMDRVFSELLRGTFRISSRSDRMGYRLEGRTLAAPTNATMITAPTTMGLVQVPPSGEPILLMADRQTTGGYAPAAVVIAADLPLAGQLGPGHLLRFERCTHDDARRARRAREAQLLSLVQALRP